MIKKIKSRKKKRKKTTTPPKPRTYSLFMGSDYPGGPPKHAFFQLDHERNLKPPKVIARTPVDVLRWMADKELSLEQVHEWMEFDHFFAIDTNTKNGVAVSYALKCRFEEDPDSPTAGFKCHNELFVAFKFDCSDSSGEIKGIKGLIDKILQADWYSEGQQIAILTDVYLENFPIDLPPGFSKLYASADKSDIALNRLIRECDKQATWLLKKFQANSEKQNGA